MFIIATISTPGPKARDATRRARGRARYLLLTLLAATTALSSFPGHLEKRFAINLTASMPRGIYRLQSPQALKVGDLVVVMLPPAAQQFAAARRILAPGGAILKRVVAMSGDRVCRIDCAVAINGRFVTIARRRNRENHALLHWSGCLRVRRHELFVLGQTLDSFDSRYFGPVDRTAIIAFAQPIWIFGN